MITRITRGRIRANSEAHAFAAMRKRIGDEPGPTPGLVRYSISRRAVDGCIELVAITIWADTASMAAALGPDWSTAAWTPEVMEQMTDSTMELLETVSLDRAEP